MSQISPTALSFTTHFTRDQIEWVLCVYLDTYNLTTWYSCRTHRWSTVTIISWHADADWQCCLNPVPSRTDWVSGVCWSPISRVVANNISEDCIIPPLLCYATGQTQVWCVILKCFVTSLVSTTQSGVNVIGLHGIFNGGWAVLKTLDSLIDWFNSFIQKNGVNFQVFLECVSPAFLTT